MCDDDNVTPVSSQEILKLSGGGNLIFLHEFLSLGLPTLIVRIEGIGLKL